MGAGVAGRVIGKSRGWRRLRPRRRIIIIIIIVVVIVVVVVAVVARVLQVEGRRRRRRGRATWGVGVWFLDCGLRAGGGSRERAEGEGTRLVREDFENQYTRHGQYRLLHRPVGGE